jgi:fumarate hydratase class II
MKVIGSLYVFFSFDVKIAAAVAQETDLPFVTAENKFEALVSDYMHTIVGYVL